MYSDTTGPTAARMKWVIFLLVAEVKKPLQKGESEKT